MLELIWTSAAPPIARRFIPSYRENNINLNGSIRELSRRAGASVEKHHVALSTTSRGFQRVCPLARKSDFKTTRRTIKALSLSPPTFVDCPSAPQCVSRDFLTRVDRPLDPPARMYVSEGNLPMIITYSVEAARASAIHSRARSRMAWLSSTP